GSKPLPGTRCRRDRQVNHPGSRVSAATKPPTRAAPPESTDEAATASFAKDREPLLARKDTPCKPPSESKVEFRRSSTMLANCAHRERFRQNARRVQVNIPR